jgi:NADH-quinone oxidoreductase subunit N
MSLADALTLLPLEITAGTAIAVMVAITIARRHAVAAALSMAGLAAAFASLWFAPARQVSPLLVVDSYGLYYFGLILAAAFVVCLLSYGYLKGSGVKVEELYLLVPIATLGSGALVFSSHFVSFFLGLELLSVSLYALIGYLPLRARSLEAGVKYLVLAAGSTAFLLFGMALIYAELGTMEFARIAELVRRGSDFTLLVPGTVLLVTGIGFKLAVAPFHMWTPDIYEGAPAPVTAFVATVSKGAMFALLMRYSYGTGTPGLGAVFAVVAIASMIAGNLLALRQRNVKRILAYSSIAHLGYILVAFDAGGALAPPSVAFYLTAYFITTLGAFGVVAALSGRDRDADSIDDYRGLFWRRPLLASVFAAMLLSLAGIPLTAGFMAKVYVVAAGASAALWTQVLVLAITSGIGLYYYLRVVVAMFAAGEAAAAEPRLAAPSAVALAALSAALIWLGVYPGPLLALIQAAVAGMG